MTTTVSRKGTVLNGDTSDTACLHSNAFGGLWRHPDFVKLWPTLAVMAVGQFLAPLWVLLSPVRELRTQPTPASAQGIAVP